MADSYTDLVWVQTSFIGDVVLTTAAIELAARKLPHARQHVVTTGIGARALGEHPALASRVVFDKRAGGTLAAFRRVRSELAAQLGPQARPVLLMAHRSFRSHFLGRYLGHPMIAYDEADAAFLAHRRVSRVAVLHEAQRIALLLQPLGVTREDIAAARPFLPAAAAPSDPALGEELAALRRGGVTRLVVLAPGSVWGTKRWTEEGFVALAGRMLAADPALGVALIGAGPEAPAAARIAAALPEAVRARALDLAGRTTLDDLRWLFPQAALVVSNDSSPIHFASALDVPTVGVFGATVPEMGFGPLASRRGTAGLAGLACRPCSDHGPQVCPLGHFKCMRELDADQVLEVCRQVGGLH